MAAVSRGADPGGAQRDTRATAAEQTKALNSKGGAAGGTGPARFIMIGGFLGAGKTMAVGRLAARLTEQGLRVGLITNDQGRNLVDTAMLRSQRFATEEIPGGCFCCRFDSLVEAADDGVL